MARAETRQYWEEQLSEFWGSGFSIPEYCELKNLPRESSRRWIRIFEKEREKPSTQSPENEIELVELKSSRTESLRRVSGISLRVGEVEVILEKDFDSQGLAEVLKVLGTV